MIATPILATSAASDRVTEALRRHLERARLAEVHLGQARKALAEAAFQIESIGELVAAFPGTDEDKRRASGELGDLARKLDWLDAERAGLEGKSQRRAPLTAADLTAELGKPWTRSKVYRWLSEGRFPGVTQPGGPGTQYLIPSDTAERINGNVKEA